MKEVQEKVLAKEDPGRLSLEVEHALEREIGRAEIASAIDALLEEGYHIKSADEIVELIDAFIHDKPAQNNKSDQ